MAGRVFNGQEWTDVQEIPFVGKERPLPPILNGDGKIFVSIPSFRDGERCGKTIADLFANAQNPDEIVVGIIDQSYETDTYCLEAYCKAMGTNIYDKREIRADTTKVVATPDRATCPRIDQIRKLSVHNYAAKGPVWARSLTRKILGNEEFCLQIDAHTAFVQDWDDKLKHEWAATGNEFGILSTVPLPIAELTMPTEESNAVPRQCHVEFVEVGVPQYTARGDGKVQNLQKPLLSHAWSAGFSFSKCHLEEVAPYDPFTPYVMGVEQFARFARFWTRGYDVYTPTQNIVYHDFQANAEGHGAMEWLLPRFERFRQSALKRVRSILNLPKGDETLNVANVGIYGLGKRRTLQQLADFVRIDMESQVSRADPSPCGDDAWVPFNENISPTENLLGNPNDLDPQPEFPLRTNLTFAQEAYPVAASLEMLEGDFLGPSGVAHVVQGAAGVNPSPFPSATLLVFWVIGLCFWCGVYFSTASLKQGMEKTLPTTVPSSSKKEAKEV
eukprot:Nitzschia sp. Nitz4//scaffold82_size85912//42151//44131//NITZ4_005142-RA/size85912-snap-gene-0.140-mRNA-1//-1//CDS//3329558838//931//frame0